MGGPKTDATSTDKMVKFWNESENLTVHEGLLLRGKQIIIPLSPRTEVLRHLHDGHQGITKPVKTLIRQCGGPDCPKTLK